jgi:hypothetical protein
MKIDQLLQRKVGNRVTADQHDVALNQLKLKLDSFGFVCPLEAVVTQIFLEANRKLSAVPRSWFAGTAK